MGEVVELAVGDLIGRSWNAKLRLADPRVSEAHAMVSLRGSALKLLALRGRFMVEQRTLQEVDLEPGLIVWLTPDVHLEVLATARPDAVLAIEGDGLARHVLGGVSALRVAPRPTLTPGYSADADALLWHDGLGWVLRLGPDDDRPLVAGDTWVLADRTFRAVAVAVEHAGQDATLGRPLDPPLRIVLRFDSVHIHRADAPVVAVSGMPARVMSELGTIGTLVAWDVVAREIWPDADDLVALRRRWDVSIARLRERLRAAGIRADLVRADGSGNFELLLEAHDQIVDET